MVETAGALRGTTACISYVDPTSLPTTRNPWSFAPTYPCGEKDVPDEFRSVMIETFFRDARGRPDVYGLEKTGFTLAKHRSAVRDFYDEGQIEEIYIPEITELMLSLTGAKKVICYSRLMRDTTPGHVGHKGAFGAHVDYDADTLRRRAFETIGEEAHDWVDRPFCAHNIWRPIRPVECNPLGVCDGASVEKGDLHSLDIWETANQPPYTGKVVSYNPRQKWYYFPDMQPDEALIFKQCETEAGKIQCCPHAAFDDGSALPQARPRVNYELRTISFF